MERPEPLAPPPDWIKPYKTHEESRQEFYRHMDEAIADAHTSTFLWVDLGESPTTIPLISGAHRLNLHYVHTSSDAPFAVDVDAVSMESERIAAAMLEQYSYRELSFEIRLCDETVEVLRDLRAAFLNSMPMHFSYLGSSIRGYIMEMAERFDCTVRIRVRAC